MFNLDCWEDKTSCRALVEDLKGSYPSGSWVPTTRRASKWKCKQQPDGQFVSHFILVVLSSWDCGSSFHGKWFRSCLYRSNLCSIVPGTSVVGIHLGAWRGHRSASQSARPDPGVAKTYTHSWTLTNGGIQVLKEPDYHHVNTSHRCWLPRPSAWWHNMLTGCFKNESNPPKVDYVLLIFLGAFPPRSPKVSKKNV